MTTPHIGGRPPSSNDGSNRLRREQPLATGTTGNRVASPPEDRETGDAHPLPSPGVRVVLALEVHASWATTIADQSPACKVRKPGHAARTYSRTTNTDNQLLDLRRYVGQRGWRLSEYVDEGINGAKQMRPELDRLVN